jgi:predicted transcriptional regulator
MRELKQEGLTYRKIGRRLGISTSTVSLYLGERRKRGIMGGLRRRLGNSDRHQASIYFSARSSVRWRWASG